MFICYTTKNTANKRAIAIPSSHMGPRARMALRFALHFLSFTGLFPSIPPKDLSTTQNKNTIITQMHTVKTHEKEYTVCRYFILICYYEFNKYYSHMDMEEFWSLCGSFSLAFFETFW